MGLLTLPIFNCGELSLPFAEWKDLTKAIDRFDPICSELGVRDLGRFTPNSRQDATRIMSEDEVLELEEEMEAEFKNSVYYLPNGDLLYYAEDQWYAPADGLKTVGAILAYIEQSPNMWSDEEEDNLTAEGIVEVLGALKSVLEKAQKKDCLFHLQLLC